MPKKAMDNTLQESFDVKSLLADILLVSKGAYLVPKPYNGRDNPEVRQRRNRMKTI